MNRISPYAKYSTKILSWIFNKTITTEEKVSGVHKYVYVGCFPVQQLQFRLWNTSHDVVFSQVWASAVDISQAVFSCTNLQARYYLPIYSKSLYSNLTHLQSPITYYQIMDVINKFRSILRYRVSTTFSVTCVIMATPKLFIPFTNLLSRRGRLRIMFV